MTISFAGQEVDFDIWTFHDDIQRLQIRQDALANDLRVRLGMDLPSLNTMLDAFAFIQPEKSADLLDLKERVRTTTDEWEGLEFLGEQSFWTGEGPFPEKQEEGKKTTDGVRWEALNLMTKREIAWDREF